MQTFQDFIGRRFQYNEDSGMQSVLANPNIENVNNDLSKIIEYVFGKDELRKKMMNFLSGLGDPELGNMLDNLRSTVNTAGNDDFYDKPLGSLKGSKDEDPAIYPNQQQDSSSHFGR
jgi:hypothetical protein